MQHLEIEYKTMLNIDEFQRLDSLYQHVKPVQQTNYYIDTNNFDLKAKKLSLRVRTYAGCAELTLKIPQTVGNLEYNQELPLDVARAFKQAINLPNGVIRDKLIAAGVNLEELEVLGNLTTRRREVKLDIGLIAIDSNTYAGIKDYELELEVSDSEQGKADFDAFLEKHRISFKYAKSKVGRFVTSLKKK